jgi:sec-independent protein translocase protein TatB
MLPEIGASELLVIAIVALIVVGPKDLPVMLRKFGQFMAKLRGMASEFRASFDEMARQTELDDLRKEVEAMRRGLPPLQLNEAARDIENSLADVGVNFGGPPMGAQHEAFQAAEAAQAAPAPKKPRARKATAAAAPAKAAAPARKKTAAAKPAARRQPRSSKIVEGG